MVSSPDKSEFCIETKSFKSLSAVLESEMQDAVFIPTLLL